jgi:threonine dehydratase
LELLEQVSDLDAIIVPVSGGGLSSGISVAVKAINPHIKSEFLFYGDQY